MSAVRTVGFVARDHRPRPLEPLRSPRQARGQSRARGVAHPSGCGDDPIVGVAVRIRERLAGTAEVLLDQPARGDQLALESRVVEQRQVRMGACVGADLPPGVGELGDLRPGEAYELVAVGGVEPMVDTRPRHRALASDVCGGDEDGRRDLEAREDREGELGNGAVAVVEGDRERPGRRRIRDRPAEGRRPISPAEQVLDLAGESVRPHRKRIGPAITDGVVTEDEYVAHLETRPLVIARGEEALIPSSDGLGYRLMRGDRRSLRRLSKDFLMANAGRLSPLASALPGFASWMFQPEHPLIALLEEHEVEQVLDVGANEGQFASKLRLLGYRGEIVSYEPIAAVFERLAARSSRDSSWRIIRTAVGSSSGEAEIHVTENTAMSSLLDPSSEFADRDPAAKVARSERVPVGRLDELAPLAAGNRFLKIDVQGSEADVLDGAEAVLETCAGVQVELSLATPFYEGEATSHELRSRLEDHGLTQVVLNPLEHTIRWGSLLQADAIFWRLGR